MRQLNIILLTYLALACQVSLRTDFTIGSTAPDFLWLVLVAVVLTIDGWPVIFWAALVGLLSDSIAGDRLGVGMLSVSIVALIAQTFRQSRLRQSAIAISCWVCFIVFAASLLTFSSRIVMTDYHVSDFGPVLQVVFDAAYTSLLGLATMLCWWIVKRLVRQPRSLRTQSAMRVL